MHRVHEGTAGLKHAIVPDIEKKHLVRSLLGRTEAGVFITLIVLTAFLTLQSSQFATSQNLAFTSRAFSLAVRVIVHASPPQQDPSTSSGTFGKPVSDMTTRNAAATTSALGWAKICPTISSPSVRLLPARVTISAAPSDTTNAGSWLTRPSPIVSFV